MQHKITLQIPTPCHENWDNMDGEYKKHAGRYCNSCQKNVVDFTNMSDAEVLMYFSISQAHVCGRFEKEQLNRVFETPPPPKKSWYKWMAAALLSGFMVSNKIKAQANRTPKVNEIQNEQVAAKTFEMQRCPFVLHGVVSDSNGKPLVGAVITIKGNKNSTYTNAQGKYFLNINGTDQTINIIMQVSYIGYFTVEKQIDITTGLNIKKLGNPKFNADIMLRADDNAPIKLATAVNGNVLVVTEKTKKFGTINSLRSVFPSWAMPVK